MIVVEFTKDRAVATIIMAFASPHFGHQHSPHFGAPIPSELLPADDLEAWRLHARQAIYEEEVTSARQCRV